MMMLWLQSLADPVVWERIERLGGWVVVVWVVAYFMREIKSDRKSHEQEVATLMSEIKSDRKSHTEEVATLMQGWERVVSAFETFEKEETATHRAILEKLDDLNKKVS